MMHNGTVDLLHYANIVNYTPQIGDLVIKHGWFTRVKWFGVITDIIKDQMGRMVLNITINGLPRLLVSTPIEKSKTIQLLPSDLSGSIVGSYSVITAKFNATILYC